MFAFNLFLLLFRHLGVAGVGLATVIAEYLCGIDHSPPDEKPGVLPSGSASAGNC